MLKNDCNQTLQGSQAVPPDYYASGPVCKWSGEFLTLNESMGPQA